MRTDIKENRIGHRNIARDRPPADRGRRRTGLAAGGLWRPAVHGGRPGPLAPGPPGRSSSGWARACTTGRGTTAFGPSRPNPGPDPVPARATKGVFPAGIAAANLLGFTTQNPARIELATNGLSLPRLIVGKDTGRPYPPAGIVAGTLRDGRRPARLPPQPGAVE